MVTSKKSPNNKVQIRIKQNSKGRRKQIRKLAQKSLFIMFAETSKPNIFQTIQPNSVP
ncbi:hypothetical protein CDL15_Pgr008358 [Punica granatum]|uniref:Uncharacterized protein n=1 Tax=Punica granatum TaxID=22663 RepID=A0A218WMG4_PUNGR|nr:hypothetical protein CDL15_Pgr008358 [Punica granatum]